MTVSSEVSQVSYATDGVTTAFPVPFYFLANDQLRVWLYYESTGVETDLMLGSSYNVVGAGDPSGGTVTTTAAYPAGPQLRIERVVPITQETAYQRNDPFPERAHERALDKLTMICQQLASFFGLLPGSTLRALLLGRNDVDGQGSYRANNNRIQDLRGPVDMHDAVNKQYVAQALSNLATDGSGQFVVERLIDGTDPVNGAGMVSFNQARSYATGTVGDQLRNGVSMGSNRGGYVVSGVIRRDTSIAPDWETIQDSTHKPMNGLTPAGGTTDLILNFKSGPVGAMICAPDETFAKDGASFGISGGGGTALMSIGVPCTFLIDLATATISNYNTRYFAASRFSVSVNGATGGITITHPPSFSHFRPIIQHAAANSLSEALLPHYVLNSGLGSGTTTLQLLGEAEGQVTYNGTSWGITTSAWTNAECTFSYDAGTGVMTVTHPPVVGSPGLSVTPLIQSSGTFIAGAAAVPTSTGFQVRFRTLSDTVPALVSGLGFLFSRGISAPRKAPTGTLLVDVGRVQAAANQVDSPTGNVWIIGVNNLS